MKYVGKITDAKDLVTKEYVDSAVDALSSSGSNYGTCSTAAGTQMKQVTIAGVTALSEGLRVTVKFTYAQDYSGVPTLKVNSLAAKSIYRTGSNAAGQYEWPAGAVIDFVYNGTYWVIADGRVATTTYFGMTRLTTSATSAADSSAATPASINNLAQNMLSGVGLYSPSSTYAVGDRVRYGYYIYECTTAITTAEAWTAAHWTALASLQDQIDAKVPTQVAVNTTTGVVTFKNEAGTALFTLQLPLYTGSVS